MAIEPGQTKPEIRSRALAARRALTPAAVATGSRAIHARLRALPAYQAAEVVLCYAASKDNEVETRPLIEEALAAGRTLLVPVMQPGKRLAWSRLRQLQDLTPNHRGILEPVESARDWVIPPDAAVCIVPGVAFRRDGYRVGYGGGYYDRFLSSFGGLSIGLSFSCQIMDCWAPDNFDVPVDVVLTEDHSFVAKA